MVIEVNGSHSQKAHLPIEVTLFGIVIEVNEESNWKVKSAIDVISSGVLNQNFTSSINILIEMAASSQKKGVYSLKDAYMIYLAIEGIEGELQNEVNRMNGEIPQESPKTNGDNKSGENVIVVPPKQLKKKS
jgi:hypothetical protein